MAKKIQKKLRYNRRKDTNNNCYLDNDGSYVYTIDVDHGRHTEKEIVCRINPDDYPNGVQIVLTLAECDRYEDEQEDAIYEHTDKVFQKKLLRFESDDDRQFDDPWESVAFANDGKDLFSQLFPDDTVTDERLARLQSFISTLQPQQIDLIYQHLGAQRTLEELRMEEQERTGKTISQQAYSDRWKKILDRICKFFNVPKPHKRKGVTDKSPTSQMGACSFSPYIRRRGKSSSQAATPLQKKYTEVIEN